MTAAIINLALPKGDILGPVAELLARLQFPVSNYHAKNRTYRPEVSDPAIRAKIMAEKDVGLQVAVGNYDVGFCGLDWVREHQIKYKATRLHGIKEDLLPKGQSLYACSGQGGGIDSLLALQQKPGYVTLISEYPEIAKDFAIRHSLRKFKIFSAWGSVEGYPPEHADVVLLTAENEEDLRQRGLVPLSCEFRVSICLVVNTDSMESKDLSPVLQFFNGLGEQK